MSPNEVATRRLKRLLLEEEIWPNKIDDALDKGASPNIRVHRDMTALMYACEVHRYPALVISLIAKGADVNARDDEGRAALARYLVSPDLCYFLWDEASLEKLFAPLDSEYIEIFTVLVESGSDVNARDARGRTPLMGCAVQHAEPFFARELLRLGADPSLRDGEGKTALLIAVGEYAGTNGNVPMVALLSSLTQPERSVANGDLIPLVAAIQAGNAHAARALLDAGDVGIIRGPGLRHLEPVVAAAAGDTERLQAVLRGDHSIEARTATGRTPLMWAAVLGQADAARLLLDSGAELENTDPEGNTALFFAAQGGHAGVCRLLLERGANPNGSKQNVLEAVIKWNGEDPEHQSHREVGLLLWDTEVNKADIDAYPTAASGFSEFLRPMWLAGKRVGPLEAAIAGEIGLLRDVLDYGFANDKDEYYFNDALGAAILRGRRESVDFMIAYGVDVNMRHHASDITPLMRAAQRGEEDLVQKLLEAGAHPELRSIYGDTAASFAVGAGHTGTAAIIEKWMEIHKNGFR